MDLQRPLKNEKVYFLKNLTNEPLWKGVKKEFDFLLRNPIWLNIEKLNADTAYFLRKNYQLKEACIKKTLELLNRCKKSGKAEKELCCADNSILGLPIVIDDKNYGYVAVIHFSSQTPASVINILKAFLKSLALKSQMNLELDRLYETISPRTMALSTIHTLHRIMNSNLNLEELLPRIARLSLQILGAAISKIYLFEGKKVTYTPKVAINLKENTYNIKLMQFEKNIVEKIAKTATPVLKNDIVAVPLLEEEVFGLILVAYKTNGKTFTYFDQDILSTMAEQAVIAIKNSRLFEQQEQLALGSIKSLSTLLKTKEDLWHSHIPTFKIILTQIAQILKLSEKENLALQNAALLHDIEKINIPEEILKKNKPLTKKEYSIIREHPIKTVKILEPLQSVESAIPILLHHHERFDGTGYPSGLKHEQIPIGARIMAVVETFEAIITDRPWRKALGIEDAILEIKRNSGVQFDPLIVESFLKVLSSPQIRQKLKNIKKRNSFCKNKAM